MGVALIDALLTLWPGEVWPFRAIAAASLVLVLPGYAATAALFPRRLDWADWLLLTPSLSLAFAALGGLALHFTPWGLTPPAWAVLLLALTVTCGLVAAWRRSRVGAGDVSPTPVRSPGFKPMHALPMFGAALVVGAAIWVAREPVPQQPEQGYAMLWALPADPAATGLRVGVQNLEPTAGQYNLRIIASGQTLQQFAIDLQPVDSWEADITLPQAIPGPVEALLYRADTPDVVYRRTLLRTGP
jgi:uncharacterized membrane protein